MSYQKCMCMCVHVCVHVEWVKTSFIDYRSVSDLMSKGCCLAYVLIRPVRGHTLEFIHTLFFFYVCPFRSLLVLCYILLISVSKASMLCWLPKSILLVCTIVPKTNLYSSFNLVNGEHQDKPECGKDRTWMKLTGALVTGLAGLSIWLWQWRGALCVSVSNLITTREKEGTDMLVGFFSLSVCFGTGISECFTLCTLTFHSSGLSTSEPGKGLWRYKHTYPVTVHCFPLFFRILHCKWL